MKKQTSPAYVYIARCADTSLYTGSTTDPERRERQHNDGTASKYTASRRPVKLVFKCKFSSMGEALSVERKIKNWSRTKKQRLVAGEFDLKKELAAGEKATQFAARNRVLSGDD